MRVAHLTDRDRSGEIHSSSAAAIPKAVTIAGIGGHLRRNTQFPWSSKKRLS